MCAARHGHGGRQNVRPHFLFAAALHQESLLVIAQNSCYNIAC
jgi:hypothetical protein